MMTDAMAPSPIAITRYGAGIVTIDNFLRPQECADLIARSEQIGCEEAVISTDEGDRVLYDNPALAAALFARALPWLPPEIDGWRPCGMNERFRFYRYTVQQFFKWHQDGTFRRSEHEESFLTFIMYLNDVDTGGATAFPWEKIAPKAGSVLVFPHRLRHQGAAIVAGTKYVLRTDVMYRESAG